MTTSPEQEAPLLAIRRYVWRGMLFAVLLVGLVGGWMAFTTISGAVIASGAVKVLSEVKKVQPGVGGVVAGISVHNGQHVTAGDALVQLDDTVARANLNLIQKSLAELHARRSRLIAERDGRAAINFDPTDFANVPSSVAEDIRQSEARLFSLRKTTYDGRKAQLKEQIAQIEQEVAGNSRQIESNAVQQRFISEELEGTRELWEKKLVPLARVSSLEREAARLDGEKGRLQAAVAQLAGKSSELKLAILQVDKELFSDVALELRDVEAKIQQVEEQRVAAQEQLDMTVIHAPQDGVIHQLAITTVGGVVGTGDVLMLVVPVADRLVVDARLSPTDVDQVSAGAEALLRFPAFNQRTTPEITGKIDFVSADTTSDPQSGLSFYTTRILVSDEELHKLRDFALVPGMPVEIFVKTGDRTVTSILAKPLLDQMDRAFRQD